MTGIISNFYTAATLILENSISGFGGTTLEGFMIVLFTVAASNCVLLSLDVVYTWLGENGKLTDTFCII